MSHIIPDFIVRWMKKTSATGFFRFGLMPDKRQQDGFKRELLCKSCEGRLSVWERAFAEKVFRPLSEGQGFEPFEYGPWLAKFAVSLSWRVLLEIRAIGPIAHVPADVLPKVDEAEAVWRSFLLEKRVYLSPFDHHLIPLGFVDSQTTAELPPNINRYFACSFAIDLVYSKDQTFIYTKLPFAIVIGVIRTWKPWEWAGTQLKTEGGFFGQGKSLGMPGGLHQYITSKAKKMSELARSLSPRQQAVVDDFVDRNPDRVANSRTFEALRMDVEIFGKAAFARKDPDLGSEEGSCRD